MNSGSRLWRTRTIAVLTLALLLAAVWAPALTGGAAGAMCLAAGAVLGPADQAPVPGTLSGAIYKLIGWNDLGMHCMNESFADIAVLPPYNTLVAQVVRQGTEPQVITTGVSIEYNVIDNTYSAGKTDFWTYAPRLFGVNLPPNVGLTGATLSGSMSARPDHFVIEGVPLTPYLDSAPSFTPQYWYPYQRVHMVAKDSATGQVLAETTTVGPVSTEMRCDKCHADGKEPGGRTGKVETNILTLHDRENGTNLLNSRPVLCANCHGSNALGMPGRSSLPNLSRAMHSKHASPLEKLGPDGCYSCHPGEQTQCLRDVMWAKGLTCTTCHGNMEEVAKENRRPWIDLPRCADCHEPQYAENAGKRYRDSTGHGGLYCEACHGSPHAILPTNQPNDNLQNIALQGFPGTLSDCSVCHGSAVPSGPGPHGLSATTPPPGATATAVRTPSVSPSRTANATRTLAPTQTPRATRTPTATPVRRGNR